MMSSSPDLRDEPDGARHDADRGSVLILVLVMIVIGSLVVVPTLSYAIAVTRHNTALSAKTSRIEAVKSGLRLALADPQSLYERCGSGATLASTTTSGHTVRTTCEFIDFQVAQAADELRLGLVATEVGSTPPVELSGDAWVPSDPSSTTEWQSATTLESTTGQIWLPYLPVHALDRRSPDGYEMPDDYPECTVYFPGTYVDPVELDGPTYFTSGIYYFEEEVRVAGGAAVVVGLGATPGCSSDQEAAFYAENAPGTHNINGLGATWIFGNTGRLAITNENGGDVAFTFNQRYVAPGDVGAGPSQDISILTVNGDIDPASIVEVDGQVDRSALAGIDLEVPGVIDVPLSLVVGDENPIEALAQEYLPSVLTPKPAAPAPPTDVVAQRRRNAAIVSWTPTFDGGSPITQYIVVASTGGGCTTQGATTCAVTGLANGTPVTFTVEAVNAIGVSEVSDPSESVTPSSTSSTLAVPSRPSPPTATPYEGVARVSWTTPTNDGGAPITGYTVTASPGGATCTVATDVATAPDLTCDVEGLDPALPVTFSVTATNAVGDSPASNPSAAVLAAPGLGAPPELPTPEPYVFEPTPVIDVWLPEPTNVTVSIPGYVAVPQGRVAIDNPHGRNVRMAGGVLAAQFDVTDARANGPQSIPIGFLEAVVQRKFRIISWTESGNERSTAVVQVNQNGAYAINSWEVQ